MIKQVPKNVIAPSGGVGPVFLICPCRAPKCLLRRWLLCGEAFDWFCNCNAKKKKLHCCSCIIYNYLLYFSLQERDPVAKNNPDLHFNRAVVRNLILINFT